MKVIQVIIIMSGKLRINPNLHSSEKLRDYIQWLLENDRDALAKIMGKYYNEKNSLREIALLMHDQVRLLERFTFKIGYIGADQEWVDTWMDKHIGL